ncbi:hypothetical protein V2P20_09215 [Methylobacter sp. Wu1]|uniref:hypothetical protein n=1 Tax=Methylobacter sp. Wu1 TaxID=3119359 RepID=UPI002F9422A0
MTERELAYRAKMQSIFPNYVTREEFPSWLEKQAEDLDIKRTKLAIEKAERLKAAVAKYKQEPQKEWLDYQE